MKKTGASDKAASSRDIVPGASSSGQRTFVPTSVAPLENPSAAAPLPPLPTVDPEFARQLERLLDSLHAGTDNAAAYAHLKANLVFPRSRNPVSTSVPQIPPSSPQIPPSSPPKTQSPPPSPKSRKPISNPISNPMDEVDSYSGATLPAEELDAVVETGEVVEKPIAHPTEGTLTPRLEEAAVELPTEDPARPSPGPEEGNHALNIPSPSSGGGSNSAPTQEHIDMVVIEDDMEVQLPLPSDLLLQSRGPT